ncbi:hypothetical protein POTOM_048897 [Populus tomentosa]|uniref:DNA-directed RNA polymerase subunit beta n=1 Tax=Populus tomentosa TaxID=118781 RepID=A0A8X7Y8S3_POPTO|nr:hypothetical protein POTOM_048897 [Populus tomentosa]
MVVVQADSLSEENVVDHLIDKQKHAAAPVKSAVNKFQLLPEFLKVRGLVKQHLDSFNYFINIGIKKIVRANDRIVSTVDPSLYLRFTDVKIGKPSMVVDAISEQITPHMCRLSDTTYAAPILVNIEYISGSHGRKEKMIKNDVVIGRMPIMLRSCCCVLYGKNEAELARLGECPLDPGGYFVVKGTEKVILIQEQLSKNRIIIDNDKKGKELTKDHIRSDTELQYMVFNLLDSTMSLLKNGMAFPLPFECINASVTSSTEATKSKTVILMEKEKMYLCLNQFAKKIPIMVVMKAMGMESDQEVVQMVGRDPRYSMLLLPSIEECASHGVYTQQQALEYLEAMVKRSTYSSSSTEKQENRALAILRDVFIANVPVRKNNFRPKCIYVAVMLRRMMEALLNKDAMDDKDYVGNKRLELSGQLISLLFEDLFKTMITEVQKTADTLLVKQNRSSRFDFSQYIVRDSITNGLERALSTGNWDVKRFRMNRKGVTQVLVRLSYMASLGHMTRISPQFEKSRKVSGPRALQPSQWGMLCPCDTPEGEACGLVKNLALMTHVTTDEEESPLISLLAGGSWLTNSASSVNFSFPLSLTLMRLSMGKLLPEVLSSKRDALAGALDFNKRTMAFVILLQCKCLGVEDLELLSGEELHTPNSFLVIFNGLILGKHRRPQQFANAMRKLRRAGKIGEFVSVFVNEKQHAVYIASDGGRVCRPLVIADKGVSRIKEHHMRELMDGARTFDDFLHEGLIEYLDVNEENNALIALYEWEATPETTHIEIEPFTILGVVAGLIPYPHHNQSPRNTYQCAMGKQAMGNIAYNQASSFMSLIWSNYYILCRLQLFLHLGRMDSLLYLLVYPQRPLLTTRTIELVGYDKLGAGQNATVAVMSYSGYDIEDAIVMNKASLDRGFGRCIVLKKYTCTNQKYENGASDRILRPRKNEERERVLDDDGLAAPGEIIRHGDIYINKESPIETRGPLKSAAALADVKYRPCAQIFKGTEGESCVVDRVALCSDKNNNLCIKYKIRHTRRPEVGDKFSSRHGQKGVCGTIIQQEDFPFSERGICPDLIMNPHGFPSRMTVGKMIELLGGKAGVSCGRFHYGSAFGEPSGHADTVEAIRHFLSLMFSAFGLCFSNFIFLKSMFCFMTVKHLLSMALATMERTSFIQVFVLTPKTLLMKQNLHALL